MAAMQDKLSPRLHIPPPRDEAELLRRAEAIAGLSLGRLAETLGVEVPADLRRRKGWVGALLEAALGADAASLAEPDFRAIGVELKSLPLDAQGRPRESTYVCTVPLDRVCSERWEESWLRRKLARVLWLPVEAEPEIPLAERRIGNALLWSPSDEQAALLRRDWEELMEALCLRGPGQLTARMGQMLQVRPKAAHSRVLAPAVDDEGAPTQSNPRGFYLRPAFTRSLLEAL